MSIYVIMTEDFIVLACFALCSNSEVVLVILVNQ